MTAELYIGIEIMLLLIACCIGYYGEDIKEKISTMSVCFTIFSMMEAGITLILTHIGD